MGIEGQQLGHYHVRSLINRGGMGEIYLADDTHLPRQVAIKVVQSEPSAYPNAQATHEASRLFDREMRLISSLDHPSILQLLDYGNETILGKPTTYMVMPYRHEGSLIDWLRRRGSAEPLPATDVAALIRQAADALQHAHDRNILHMDVKPSNFLVRERRETPNRPDLLLADFGISKGAEGTKSTTARGTLAYMSTEQWNGNPSPASDQYSLAIMACELLAGRVPFLGNEVQVMYQHMQATPTPPSTVNPRVPRALDAVILRALAKNPQSRYPSVRAFADAFQQAASIPNNLTPPPPPPNPWPPQPQPQPINPWPVPQPAPQPKPNNNRTLLTVLVIAVVLIGGVGLLFAVLPKTGGGSIGNATPTTQPTQPQNTPAPTNTPVATPSPTSSATLVLDDPMTSNKNNWAENSNCSFNADGTYHVVQQKANFLFHCEATSTNFSNFGYQVDMNILSGDGGGIVFCYDNTLPSYYFFRITTNGEYGLFRFSKDHFDNLINNTASSAIKTGINQTNVIGVVDSGGSIVLYINGTKVNTYNDSQLPSGEIGVVADNIGNSTEVSFSNVKVWK
jgi:serine/threonine protein kinase